MAISRGLVMVLGDPDRDYLQMERCRVTQTGLARSPAMMLGDSDGADTAPGVVPGYRDRVDM